MELTREFFRETAINLLNWCVYPAAKYKILFHFLNVPYNDERLVSLRQEFLYSDIVTELYETQSIHGNWGALNSKDYSAKDLFPTTMVAIDRCLYIGLTLDDREILMMALEHLEDYILIKNRDKLYDKNERAVPWQLADIANCIEAIKPYNQLCDSIWEQWHYITSCAFDSGTYSYEDDAKIQHEVLFTREQRLVPLPVGLLLKRRDKLFPGLEQAMLDHFGKIAYDNGHFWDKNLHNFPDSFQNKHTRRWFHTINYINQFNNTSKYLEPAINWLMNSRNLDGFWDWGTQIKDPWGYFNYLSTTRQYSYNRILNCTAEVLTVLKKYLDNNYL